MPSSKPNWLDFRDGLILKGAAILAITLHNYYHWLSPVKENEFSFRPEHFQALLAGLQDPHVAFQSLCSFFGHFGVQIFIFLSAYGLTIKYWDSGQQPWAAFVWGRVKKIHPMFLAVIAIWGILFALRHRFSIPAAEIKQDAAAIVQTLLGVSNFTQTFDTLPVGPWWFIPFIMQFYAIWFLLCRITDRFGKAGLLVTASSCLAVTYFLNDVLYRWGINLMLTPIGHMPEFCLGIASARYGFRPTRWHAMAAAVVFFLSCQYAAWWPFGFLSVLILMLGIYEALRPILRNNAFLYYLGEISMPLFLLNGVIRKPFIGLDQQWNNWFYGLVLGLVSTAVAILVAGVLSALFDKAANRWPGRSREGVLQRGAAG
jgi:peptidoglycan/LPS O-acetylase OafA/YrhL